MPCECCVLLQRGTEESAVFLGVSDGNIVKWDALGREIVRAPLPGRWSEWRLTEACCSKGGVVALFDDGASGQLARFEADSMKLLGHYIQGCEVDRRERLFSICSDAARRCYLKKGNALWLLGDTGAPCGNWYHHRVPVEKPNSCGGPASL